MNRRNRWLLYACFALVFTACQKEYSLENESNVPASGSLWDSFGVCLPDSVHGTFYNGIQPGGDTAFVELQVNVTQTGTYNISTDLQDGFYFADSGFFSTTGINTIRLKPVGVPIIPTTATFTVVFDSSFCSFDVLIQDSTGTGLGGGTPEEDLSGTWQFTTGEGTFTGTFDTAAIYPDSLVWGTDGESLLLLGPVTSLGDTIIAIALHLPTGVITPGTTYSTALLPPENAALFSFSHASGNQDPIYTAEPDAAPAAEITVTITAYDDITRVVTGTFSGTAEDKDGNADVNVVNGSFSVRVE